MSWNTSITFSVIYNGVPGPTFIPFRAIKQGDSISPYTFILCLQRLSSTISEAVNKNTWQQFSIGKNKEAFSHLFFIDDIILFRETNDCTLNTVVKTLESFRILSGLECNPLKCKILFSNNTSKGTILKFSFSHNIDATNDLGTYLGFLLSSTKPNLDKLKLVLEKVRHSISSWNSNYISKAGKITLINSIISTFPNYTWSSIFLPSSLHQALDKIIAKFF